MFFNSKKPENQIISSPISVVRSFLDERSLTYQFYEENNVFTLNLSGQNVTWRCIIHLDLDRNLLSIRNFSPVLVQDAQKIKVAELLTRLNFGFTLGHYVMNFEEGEVIFETTHLFKETNLSPDIVDMLFYISCKTFDEYFNLINKVNMGETEPFMAILSLQ